jgi:membrane-bound lytic murein transglycosylase D
MLAQLIPLMMLLSAPADTAADVALGEVPVVAPPADDAALGDEADDNARIDPTDVPDNSSDLSTDVDRWVLHDVLRTGLGQTDAWESRYQQQQQQAQGMPLASWPDRLRLARTQALLRGEPEQHHVVDTQALHFDIPLFTHPLVDVYIDYFTGRGRWVFERWLNRASQIVPIMQPILERYGVPKDLVYLAMIESGFSPHAYSSAAAAGYWQFMAPTGRLYGLQENLFVDERRDFIRSTEAAARYLSSLRRQMGDWHLAWASYNAGEGRIRRALKETKTSTFWELISVKNNLAKETVHYVPKVIAAAIVAKDAARYGFRVTPQPPWAYDEITVQDSLDITVLAKAMRLSPDALRGLNPSLLHDITPPGRAMTLRVPEGCAPRAQLALAKIPKSKRLNFLAHAVRKGDTLSGIARKFGSNVEMLRQFNHLSAKSPLRIGQKLIVPSFKLAQGSAPAQVVGAPIKRRASLPPKLAAAKGRTPARSANAIKVATHSGKKPKARHVVISGDTLWSIARRYNVTVNAIKKRPGQRSNRLAIGEVLEIF